MSGSIVLLTVLYCLAIGCGVLAVIIIDDITHPRNEASDDLSDADCRPATILNEIPHDVSENAL